MDIALGVAAGLVVGIPAVVAALRQPAATPSGFTHASVPVRDDQAGQAREQVGTSVSS